MNAAHPRPRPSRAGLRTTLLAACAALAASVPPTAHACPSCYGNAAGPVIEGMNIAVVLMIGITGGVLSWIAGVAVRIARRERHPAASSGMDGAADRGDSAS